MSRLIVFSLVLVAAAMTLAYPAEDPSVSSPGEGETVDLRHHRPHHGYGYGGYGGYGGYSGYNSGYYRPSYGYSSPYGYNNYGGYYGGYGGYPSGYGYGYRPGVLGFREAEKPGTAAAAPEAAPAEPSPSGGDAVVFQ